MPILETKHFGSVAYEEEEQLQFPAGMPGFEDQRSFLALRFAHSDPLVYLQSVEKGELCFLAVPVLVADHEYRLQVCAEELELIGLPPEPQPEIGKDVLCLAVLSVREHGGATANLLAPLVVNLKDRRGVQAVMAGSGYSHQHVLVPAEEPVCS